ncbi:hypothetical protein [Brevundimonas diminuta]
MLHLPTPMLMGAPQGKTYAEFLAHITARATSGTLPWSASAYVSGKFLVAPAARANSMLGTPWMDYFNGITSRVVQHALPSPESLDEQIAGGLKVYVEVLAIAPKVDFRSLNRNGFLSSAYNDGEAYAASEIVELLAWVGGAPVRMQPNLGLGPTPYTW